MNPNCKNLRALSQIAIFFFSSGKSGKLFKKNYYYNLNINNK